MARFVIFCVLILWLCTSCTLYRGLRELVRSKARIHTYEVHGKTIKFIPMHHLGKSAFYEDVKDKTTGLKKEGYRVYFELVTAPKNVDSVYWDLCIRKSRKINGFGGGNYKKLTKDVKFLKKYVSQPKYVDLGTDSTDIRADITLYDYVRKFEKEFGVVQLDSLDTHMSLDSIYKREGPFSTKQIHKIRVDFRNQALMDTISKYNDVKILILYGANHRKGFAKILKTYRSGE